MDFAYIRYKMLLLTLGWVGVAIYMYVNRAVDYSTGQSRRRRVAPAQGVAAAAAAAMVAAAVAEAEVAAAAVRERVPQGRRC